MFIDWKKVIEYLKKSSEDESLLVALIEKQIKKAIKETHPHTYKQFIKDNKKQIEVIKLRIKEKYKPEIQKKISDFVSLLKIEN